MSEELEVQIDRLQMQLERAIVQLAGCGVAALGGTTQAITVHQGDYGWSQAYQDTLDLRLKYDALRKQVELAVRAMEMHRASRMDGWEHFDIALAEIEALGKEMKG
jgi:hypothetical protein